MTALYPRMATVKFYKIFRRKFSMSNEIEKNVAAEVVTTENTEALEPTLESATEPDSELVQDSNVHRVINGKANILTNARFHKDIITMESPGLIFLCKEINYDRFDVHDVITVLLYEELGLEIMNRAFEITGIHPKISLHFNDRVLRNMHELRKIEVEEGKELVLAPASERVAFLKKDGENTVEVDIYPFA